MLPQKYRLSYTSFLYKNKNPISKKSYPFFLYLIKTQSANLPTKLSFIVPKRLSKLSTVRNKTKRITGEAFLSCIPKLKPGFWIVVQAKKTFDKEKLSDIQKIVENDLKQLRLLWS